MDLSSSLLASAQQAGANESDREQHAPPVRRADASPTSPSSPANEAQEWFSPQRLVQQAAEGGGRSNTQGGSAERRGVATRTSTSTKRIQAQAQRMAALWGVRSEQGGANLPGSSAQRRDDYADMDGDEDWIADAMM